MDQLKQYIALEGRYTLTLDSLSKDNTNRAGEKATNLGELLSAGFPVPDGFVVTTDAFDRFLLANNLDCNASQEKAEDAVVPSDVAEAVKAALAELGNGSVAVRSSGVAEDLPDASFAGQYETVLDVRGEDDLMSAIRHCWASAFSERVFTYRGGKDKQNNAGMAVLVQRMVQADAAGVVFTANPVTGNRTEVVVNAVEGLGERLVAGQALPDEWIVRDDEVICQRAPEGAINADQAKSVAELARRVEQYFGPPQDIEWALTAGELFLLQARPITALPQRLELSVPSEGFWMKDAAHFTSPITPFGASVYLPALDYGMATMCQEFGLPIEGIEQRSIGGEVYAHIILPGGNERSGPAPPSWILFLAMRIIPSIRRRQRIAREAFRTKLMDRTIERWYSEWRDQFNQKAHDILSVNLTELDDEELLRHLDQTIDFLRWGQAVHFRLMMPYLLRNYELTEVCRQLLGWDTAKAMLLVSGTSKTSSEPGRKLVELAAFISRYPAAKKIISDGINVIPRLYQAEPKVADALDAYLRGYGHRTTNYEPGSPTIAEKPDLLVSLLRDRINGTIFPEASDPRKIREETIKRARLELAVQNPKNSKRFEKALEAAQQTNPVREDNVFYTDNVPNALVRYAALEIGRRLVDRRIIADHLDAVYLEDTELRSALNGEQQDFSTLIKDRKSERAWVAAHPGPSSYGKEAEPPDPGIMPEPWRTMTRAQLWFMNVGLTVSPGASTNNEITGVPGSPGRYTGIVRIIRNESEFSRLMPGDVLVCPVTTPAWSMLFTQASAVVTDSGGVLSHTAIIARENGLPAVLGTRDATQRLVDGQTVTVDGSRGVVEITAV